MSLLVAQYGLNIVTSAEVASSQRRASPGPASRQGFIGTVDILGARETPTAPWKAAYLRIILPRARAAGSWAVDAIRTSRGPTTSTYGHKTCGKNPGTRARLTRDRLLMCVRSPKPGGRDLHFKRAYNFDLRAQDLLEEPWDEREAHKHHRSDGREHALRVPRTVAIADLAARVWCALRRSDASELELLGPEAIAAATARRDSRCNRRGAAVHTLELLGRRTTAQSAPESMAAERESTAKLNSRPDVNRQPTPSASRGNAEPSGPDRNASAAMTEGCFTGRTARRDGARSYADDSRHSRAPDYGEAEETGNGEDEGTYREQETCT
ncbi:hypothetical protein EXIGLDRAFT_707069 [Exidia glandulosa HHB12029]|uniref:Uncharacterized protein n=1 Tax=Exidia glandulosa HHB12029 TaxID=1314781 RepID=A0A165AUK9_EXIGL|nr:hypothetical protein EXIGLDRAFT_707069 [Exidia glandulosa HHB12029]